MSYVFIFSLCYVQFFSLCYVQIFSLCYVQLFSLCYVQFFSLCYVQFAATNLLASLASWLASLAWRAGLASLAQPSGKKVA